MMVIKRVVFLDLSYKIEQSQSASHLMSMESIEPKFKGREMSSTGFASFLNVVKTVKSKQNLRKLSKFIRRIRIF